MNDKRWLLTMHVFCSTSICLLACLLAKEVNSEETETIVTHKTITRDSGQSGFIESHNFKSHLYNLAEVYDTDGSVWVYKFQNSNIGGKIRLLFILFDLSPYSAIKIVDGDIVDDADGAVFYAESTAPIYASTGDTLTVYFKTGTGVNEEHLGFRLQYFFAGEDEAIRDPYYDGMPSTGFCGQIQTTQTSGYRFMSMRLDVPYPRIDCSYPVLTNTPVFILLSAPTIQWVLDNVVLYDHPSGKPEISTRLVPLKGEAWSSLNDLQGVAFRSLSRVGFYLRVVGSPFLSNATTPQFAVFKFAYGYQPVEARRAFEETTLPADASCPFKTCPDETCRLYWESCNSELDATCDFSGYEADFSPGYDLSDFYGYKAGVYEATDQKMCSDKHHCYNGILDNCDTIPDCPEENHNDENCGKGSFLASPVWLVPGLFLFLMFICSSSKAKRKQSSDFFCGLVKAIRECFCACCCPSPSTETNQTNQTSTTEVATSTASVTVETNTQTEPTGPPAYASVASMHPPPVVRREPCDAPPTYDEAIAFPMPNRGQSSISPPPAYESLNDSSV